MKQVNFYVIYDITTESIYSCFFAVSDDEAKKNAVSFFTSRGVKDKDTILEGVMLARVTDGIIGDDSFGLSFRFPTKFSELTKDFKILPFDYLNEFVSHEEEVK